MCIYIRNCCHRKMFIKMGRGRVVGASVTSIYKFPPLFRRNWIKQALFELYPCDLSRNSRRLCRISQGRQKLKSQEVIVGLLKGKTLKEYPWGA